MALSWSVVAQLAVETGRGADDPDREVDPGVAEADHPGKRGSHLLTFFRNTHTLVSVCHFKGRVQQASPFSSSMPREPRDSFQLGGGGANFLDL